MHTEKHPVWETGDGSFKTGL